MYLFIVFMKNVTTDLLAKINLDKCFMCLFGITITQVFLLT